MLALRSVVRIALLSTSLAPLLSHSAGMGGLSDVFESWTRKDVTDQSGKTFLITGANAGLGYEAALELARHNGHVIMATRSPNRAHEAIASIKKEAPNAKVDFLRLDLADFASVKEAAAQLKGQPIHCLVNNASVAAPKTELGKKTKDGFEITMQTNHFGPFLFTQLLLDNVKQAKPSRIIWQAASGESMAKIDWDDLKGQTRTDSTLAGEYAQTKLFNIMTAREFDKRLKGSGVTCLACQPGVSESAIYEKAAVDKQHPDVAGIVANVKVAGQSQERGATPLIFCCVSDDVLGKSDQYIGPKYLKGPINFNVGQTKDRDPKSEEAFDPAAMAKLYDMTNDILKPFR